MPAAIANRLRREIIARREGGERYTEIAKALGLAYGTVRKVYGHYQRHGQVEPNYAACRQEGVRKAAAVYAATVAMKQAHPGWGAGLIRVELANQFEEKMLPSVRTLQRWFRRAGVAAAPREPRRKQPIQRGQRVHEVWALDAKEAIELADGSQVSWLTISDEASGAVLAATVFPPETLAPSRTAAGTAESTDRFAALGVPGADTDG